MNREGKFNFTIVFQFTISFQKSLLSIGYFLYNRHIISSIKPKCENLFSFYLPMQFVQQKYVEQIQSMTISLIQEIMHQSH